MTLKGQKSWNSGTSKGWLDKRGYRWIYVVENGRKRARRENRVIMEHTLGRRLEPWEDVHHKNGDRKDNSPSNLELINHTAHTLITHNRAKRPQDAKDTMANFQRMTQEIKLLRSINTELLEACKKALKELSKYTPKEAYLICRQAIAKAEGAK